MLSNEIMIISSKLKIWLFCFLLWTLFLEETVGISQTSKTLQRRSFLTISFMLLDQPIPHRLVGKSPDGCSGYRTCSPNFSRGYFLCNQSITWKGWLSTRVRVKERSEVPARSKNFFSQKGVCCKYFSFLWTINGWRWTFFSITTNKNYLLKDIYRRVSYSIY